MANRYGRRRVDGIFEYSDSIAEIEASAVRERDEYFKERFALIGFVVGIAVTYGWVVDYLPDGSKALRLTSILAGGCLSAFVCAALSALLRMMFLFAYSAGVFGGIGYLLWRLL